MPVKILSAKWRPFCPTGDGLTRTWKGAVYRCLCVHMIYIQVLILFRRTLDYKIDKCVIWLIDILKFFVPVIVMVYEKWRCLLNMYFQSRRSWSRLPERWLERQFNLNAVFATMTGTQEQQITQRWFGWRSLWYMCACNIDQGAVSIRKTVLPGMAIPMLKIRRPNGRLIFNMEIAIRR